MAKDSLMIGLVAVVGVAVAGYFAYQSCMLCRITTALCPGNCPINNPYAPIGQHTKGYGDDY